MTDNQTLDTPSQPAGQVKSTLGPIRSTTRTTREKRSNGTSEYAELIKQANQKGLLKKVPAFYVKRFIFFCIASLTVWTSIAMLVLTGNYWLLFAVVPLVILQGVLVAQFAFIAHEASHRQVFNNNKWNDMSGLVVANLFAGLSYGFWLKKHNKHHQKPNQIGEDPDINLRVLAFTPENRDSKPAIERFFTKRQGYLFPVLLLFTGFDLLLDSFLSLARPSKFHPHRRWIEFAMIVVRQALPILFFFLLFHPLIAAPLWMIFMCSSGFFLGAAFAPNHKGMPLVPKDSTASFFHRQVLTSRNIKPSWFKDNFMGGLNYQVEHHLFPSMPRVHLKEAHELVLAHCEKHDIQLTEVGWFESFGMIISYLNKVGLSGNADPFVCPMIAEYRPKF